MMTTKAEYAKTVNLHSWHCSSRKHYPNTERSPWLCKVFVFSPHNGFSNVCQVKIWKFWISDNGIIYIFKKGQTAIHILCFVKSYRPVVNNIFRLIFPSSVKEKDKIYYRANAHLLDILYTITETVGLLLTIILIFDSLSNFCPL